MVVLVYFGFGFVSGFGLGFGSVACCCYCCCWVVVAGVFAAGGGKRRVMGVFAVGFAAPPWRWGGVGLS